MAKSCILYYITDRTAFPGDDRTRRHHLLDKITEAASAGIDYIQLREKDLPTRDLESLAREAGREVDLDGMSKAEASRLIDELQAASGRGAGRP